MDQRILKLSLYSFICLTSSLTLVNGEQHTGNTCTVARTGAEGVCTLIQNCPKAIQDIRRGLGYPTVCGHERFKQIICCPLGTTSTTAKPTGLPQNASISMRKCFEYRNFMYVNETFYTTATNRHHIKSVLKCPFDSVPLIVGGTAAELKEFPHMASIGYQMDKKIEWKCAGTLISDEFVLTAAHCKSSRDSGNPTHVRLGELNLNDTVNDGANPIDVEVSEIITHPQYKSSSKYDDIALIRLKEKVSLNEFIRPACLPTTYNTGTKRAIASGWGAVEWAGLSSEKLLKVTLDIFNHTECNTTYSQGTGTALIDGIVDETQLCAGSHTEKKDTCQGDSGGPLQIFHPMYFCMYTIVGVTSFGAACGYNLPGVYTRVYSYVNWIEEIVWSNK